MAQENWSEKTDCQAPPEAPVSCINNCGYFGSPATMNMCSKCYRDLVLLQQQQQPPRAPTAAAATVVEVTAIHSGITELTVERTSTTDINVEAEIIAPLMSSSTAIRRTPIASSELAGSSQEQSSNLIFNRCFCCQKRVGLTGFKCRCGDVFCALHRYSDKHNCSFDYKTAGRDAIAKANPLIKADKVRKI
ncbi:hypothetical protein O6H91_06G115800 [Diphasiastrum complanatum]|uniref:Uncharacterized protein n=1 Tax=Diphasiastrum complanatum TaxID=34168 RepID=A0ACC2DHU5_DIPCM|nr:hypothetical protein O6H91_06G115800 [Diphasiastrum complanatum]